MIEPEKLPGDWKKYRKDIICVRCWGDFEKNLSLFRKRYQQSGIVKTLKSRARHPNLGDRKKHKASEAIYRRLRREKRKNIV